jgi:hypothetical protein
MFAYNTRVINGCRNPLLQAQRPAVAWRKEVDMAETALIMLLLLLILRVT